MPSVEQTLTELIRTYPCSFSNRTQALHQALVVLGSGYEWRGGEVVQRFSSDGRDCLSVHGQFGRSADEKELLRRYEAELQPEVFDRTCPAEHLRTQAADLAHKAGPLHEDPYPASSGAPLSNIPQDAAADWLEAAREIAAVVVPLWATPSAYWAAVESSLSPEQRTYVNGERSRALEFLERRFGFSVLSGGER